MFRYRFEAAEEIGHNKRRTASS